ncbi:hypothetical protein D9M69_501910 [compost metagenome]
MGRTDGQSQQLLHQYLAHEPPIAAGILSGCQVVLFGHLQGIAEGCSGGRQVAVGQLEDAVGEGLTQARDVDAQWLSVAVGQAMLGYKPPCSPSQRTAAQCRDLTGSSASARAMQPHAALEVFRGICIQGLGQGHHAADQTLHVGSHARRGLQQGLGVRRGAQRHLAGAVTAPLPQHQEHGIVLGVRA